MVLPMYYGQGRIPDLFWGSGHESSTSLVPTSQLTQSIVVLSRYSYCFPTVQPILTGIPCLGQDHPGTASTSLTYQGTSGLTPHLEWAQCTAQVTQGNLGPGPSSLATCSQKWNPVDVPSIPVYLHPPSTTWGSQRLQPGMPRLGSFLAGITFPCLH